MPILLTILFFNFANISWSNESAHNTEVGCWAKSVDADGSFLCQYVIVTAKVSSVDSYIVPTLAANDPKEAALQAELACRRMGFSYSTKWELDSTTEESWMIRLSSQERLDKAWQSHGTFIQHLNCAQR